MFAVRRIFRDSKRLSDFISRSSVIKKDDPSLLIRQLSNLKNKDSAAQNVEETTQKGENVEETTQKGENVEKTTQKGEKKKKTKKAKSTEQITENVKAAKPQKDSFNKLLEKSANNVAKEFEGKKTEIKDELLNYIRSFAVVKERDPEMRRQLKKSFGAMGKIREPTGRLLIFSPDIMSKPEVKLNIWDDLEAENLANLSKRAPRNYFEELIEWTNSGKLWHFPIDNDQGNELEARTSFTEHIFLEEYLEPWCPKKGPLRRFMELVLIGLAKNHNYSVEEKIEHIRWFEDYFEKKKKLLKDLGAMGRPKEIDTPGEKEKSSDS